MFVVCCLLFVVCCLLFIACCLLFVVCCLLFVVVVVVVVLGVGVGVVVVVVVFSCSHCLPSRMASFHAKHVLQGSTPPQLTVCAARWIWRKEMWISHDKLPENPQKGLREKIPH